ncbi:MAG: hypothetical protein ACJ76F_06975 [Bacteroidia bacterium]
MKRTISIIISSVIIVFLSLIAACKSKPAPKTTCAEPNLTYTSDIKPILDVNCATTCHSAKKRAHGIDLSNYESVKASASDASFLGSIRHEGGYTPMPKNHDKLDEPTIQKIACWIQNGSKQ